jgi:hypothetical protein
VQWLVAPDFDEGGEVGQAEWQHAAVAAPGEAALLAAARSVCTPGSPAVAPADRRRVDPILGYRRVLRLPVPLTGPAALRAEASFEPTPPPPGWRHSIPGRPRRRGGRRAAVADGARTGLVRGARHSLRPGARPACRRGDRPSRGAQFVFATTLAAALDVAVKTTIRLLDGLVAAAIRPPHRPDLGRGRFPSLRWKRKMLSSGLRCRCRRSPRSSAGPSTTATSSAA